MLFRSDAFRNGMSELLQTCGHGNSSAKNRRMDAETHPHGLPEEVEEVQDKIPEPQALGTERR